MENIENLLIKMAHFHMHHFYWDTLYVHTCVYMTGLNDLSYVMMFFTVVFMFVHTWLKYIIVDAFVTSWAENAKILSPIQSTCKIESLHSQLTTSRLNIGNSLLFNLSKGHLLLTIEQIVAPRFITRTKSSTHKHNSHLLPNTTCLL